MVTFLAKIGSVIARSDKIIGRSLALPLNAVIYPMKPSSWSKSWGESSKKGLSHVVGSQGDNDDSFFDRFGISCVKFFTYPVKPSNWAKPSWGWLLHDLKNGGRYIIGMPLEEYTQFEKDTQAKDTTQASKNLAVKVKLVDYKEGKMIFEASRVLGDASRLTSKQLDQIKAALPNVFVDKGRNKISIEVDVDAIIKELKREIDAQGLEVSEKQIKMLAIQRIAEEVDSTLKKFGEISGGEFKYHTDRKLLRAIGKALYSGSVSKEKPVEKPSILQSSNEAVTRLDEKPVQGPDPSVAETLRSGADQDDLSETFRRLFEDDENLPEIAKPLVNDGTKVESQPESTETLNPLVSPKVVTEPSMDSQEAAQKAAKEAIAEARKQPARNAGIDSKNVTKLSFRTGGCGVETDSTWQERHEQSSSSKKQNLGKGGV